jgi:tellurite resistance protein
MFQMNMIEELPNDSWRVELLEAMKASCGMATSKAFRSSPGKRTEFLKAATAACVMMAQADGNVVPAERRTLLRLLRANGDLACFSPDEVSRELLVQELSFALDSEFAYRMAVATIEPVAPHRADALFVVDACRAMILADGIAETSEFEELKRIRTILAC